MKPEEPIAFLHTNGGNYYVYECGCKTGALVAFLVHSKLSSKEGGKLLTYLVKRTTMK